jgi:hypothetical protein
LFVIQPADSYSYAYLLGAYLGDGYVGDTGRSFISISHRTSVALLDENVGPKC